MKAVSGDKIYTYPTWTYVLQIFLPFLCYLVVLVLALQLLTPLRIFYLLTSQQQPAWSVPTPTTLHPIAATPTFKSTNLFVRSNSDML